MRQLAIIDYGSGNLHSVKKAFEFAIKEQASPIEVVLTNHAENVRKADAIVLPGVGAFVDCWNGLNAVPDMVEALQESVLEKARPFLGICVGMQLMASQGQEKHLCPGLDWIAGEVRKMSPEDKNLTIPKMGWNTLETFKPHPLLDDIPLGDKGWHAYFVHSYIFCPQDNEHIIASDDYGGAQTAIIGKANMVGTQFHPEKSQQLGLKLIDNFLAWRP